MTTDRIPAELMRELVESGAARPLMPGFEVVPTWYEDIWWHVPQDAADGADYVQAGPELSAKLDELRSRADQANAVLSGIDPDTDGS